MSLIHYTNLSISGEELRHLSEEESYFLYDELIFLSQSIDSLRKLHQKATIVDASFDPRVDPTTTRAAWDEVKDNLANGTHIRFLHFYLGFTADTEANAQQAFVDILDNDVIQPLVVLKASEEPFVWSEVTLLTGHPKGNGRPNKEANQGRSRGFCRKVCRPCGEHNHEAPTGILEEIQPSSICSLYRRFTPS